MPDGTQIKDRGNAIWFILPEPPKQPDEPIDPEYLNQLGDLFERKEPAKGTGKKPKGSGRRLYTDENPKDTVSIKYATVADAKKTIAKVKRIKKPYARKIQILTVLEQRAKFGGKPQQSRLAKAAKKQLKESRKI